MSASARPPGSALANISMPAQQKIKWRVGSWRVGRTVSCSRGPASTPSSINDSSQPRRRNPSRLDEDRLLRLSDHRAGGGNAAGGYLSEEGCDRIGRPGALPRRLRCWSFMGCSFCSCCAPIAARKATLRRRRCARAFCMFSTCRGNPRGRERAPRHADVPGNREHRSSLARPRSQRRRWLRGSRFRTVPSSTGTKRRPRWRAR